MSSCQQLKPVKQSLQAKQQYLQQLQQDNQAQDLLIAELQASLAYCPQL